MLVILAPGWVSGPVRLADRWPGRLRGLVPRSDHGLLLAPCRSVHGAGLVEPIWVAGLGPDGWVRRVALLPPGGVWADRRAAAVLELAWWRDPPPVGERLVARSIA